MKSNPVRLGLIGFGNAARWLHFPVLRRLSGVRLIGVADPSPERRAEAAKLAPAILVCDDMSALVSSGLDAVVVCSPSALHAQHAAEALAAGLDVYLEKPMAISLVEAERLTEVFRNSNCIGMLGLNYRFGEMQKTGCEAVQSGRLGNIVAIRGIFSVQASELPAWKRRREQGGGALLDLAVHHLDLACWMTRSIPNSVVCRIHSHASEEDTVFLEAEFPAGIGAQFFVSLCAGENDVFEIYGTKARAIIDRHRADRCEFQPAGLERVRFDRFSGATAAFFNPGYWWQKFNHHQREGSYRHAMEAFVQACHSRQPVHPDFLDGLNLARILDAAERSAAQGRRILLSGHEDGIQPAEP